ncbi:DNA repair protein SWI5 homolog isoform X2 [Ostrea edulis]|uniref:DNA repair protein SWI5 homolog isoform X2 n=1 Tax=Ostrea edulis TaxID=37623 RepID=UPI0024AFD4EB|nr:DNA repair protein SWI5 homolog isoform X2 [Ostrea edulis]
MNRKRVDGLKRPSSTTFKSPVPSKKASDDTTKKGVDENLEKKLEAINSEIAELENRGLKIEMLQTHIDKLHHYNELKDCGQVILGRIAVFEGVRTKDIYPRYNLLLDD